MRATLTRAAIIAAAAAANTSGCMPEPEPDTLRIPLLNPTLFLSQFYDQGPDQIWLDHAVYDKLVQRHTDNTYKPMLAESWRQVDPVTLDFELRRDVYFHNGHHMDADDVVYTVAWLIDPATIVNGKTRFDFIERVEKLGPYSVRIVTKEPNATTLNSFATVFPIFDSEVHGPLESKINYARFSPIGTGPYKVVEIDRSRGIVLERFKERTWGAPWKVAANIERIRGIPIANPQTQIAMLITGELHLARNLRKDMIDAIRTHYPEFEITVSRGTLFAYIAFDAINRSGREELSDQRVREAILMAIDRDAIRQHVIAGGDEVPLLEGWCLPIQRGCAYNKTALPFDLTSARRRLAEAGYGEGFDVEITAQIEAADIATAIAGNLAQLGIRATVQTPPLDALQRQRAAGEVELYVAITGFSDVNPQMNQLFANPNYNYWGDPLLREARNRGRYTLDEQERKQIYSAAFDRLIEHSYISPIAEIPTVLVHPPSIEIEKDPFSRIGAESYQFFRREE